MSDTCILKSTGQYPIHEGDIRLLYPEMGEVFILPEEYAAIQTDAWPETQENYKVVVLPLEIRDGGYFQKFEVRPCTEEELTDIANSNRETRALMHQLITGQQDLPQLNFDQKQGSVPNVIG